MFKKKSNQSISQEDLSLAKMVFFRYGGNKFGMSKNDELEKYEKYCIAKETEDGWLKELYQDYKRKIEDCTNNMSLILHIISLINMGMNEFETIELIIMVLNTRQLDSFSIIRICEEMKKIIKNSKSCEIIALIKKEITRIHDKLMLNPITISNEYLALSYMKNYDFSDANIKKRIASLLDFNR